MEVGLNNDSAHLQAFYDGACPICSHEVGYARRRDRDERVEWIDISRPTFNAPAFGLDPAKVNEALHVRGSDGKIYVGVDAAIQIMQAVRHSFLMKVVLFILKIPGMMPIARTYYRWFARNRYRLTGRCTPESCAVDGT